MITTIELLNPIKFGDDLPRRVHSITDQGNPEIRVEFPLVWIKKFGEWKFTSLTNVVSGTGNPDAKQLTIPTTKENGNAAAKR